MKKLKQQKLDELYALYKQCTACPLGTLGRTNVVFGQGNPDAQLLIIGEAPGKEEDLQGKPFIGRSGKLLDSILYKHKITRDNIYITNIVKCRPPNNRNPQPVEIKTCTRLLLDYQIAIIKPRVICTLGSIALNALHNSNKPLAITKVRGIPVQKESVTILPTFHPAYVMRSRSKLPLFDHDIKQAITLAQQKK